MLVQIKNLLTVSEVVLQQEPGDRRRNRAWYHVLLMKFCCDASAADLNGGRFKTSHIRLSVSELICTVISTPICTHTHQNNQQLCLPDHPSSHFSAFSGFTCCKRRRGAGCVMDPSSSAGRGPPCPAQAGGPDLLLLPTAWLWHREGPVWERSAARGVCTEPGLSLKHPQVTNCDSYCQKITVVLFYPVQQRRGHL